MKRIVGYREIFCNRKEKWFSEKLWKNVDLENVRSESFSIRTFCIESSRFQARVAKGGPRVQNRVSKVMCGFRKKNSAHNDQDSMKHEQK